jgi:hypothetical protein
MTKLAMIETSNDIPLAIEPTQETTEMPTKSKSKKKAPKRHGKFKLHNVDIAPAAPAAAPAAEKPKAVSKVDRVVELCSKKNGVTLSEIATELGCSKTAASSLIADGRKKGTAIKSEKRLDGVTFYWI